MTSWRPARSSSGRRQSRGPRKSETKTASDGSFRIADAANYEDWVLRVDAPAPLEDVEIGGVTVVEGKGTDLGVVYVSPAFAVEGIVVDEAGAPIEGADVRMIRAATGGASMDILRLIRELHIDPPAVDRANSRPRHFLFLNRTRCQGLSVTAASAEEHEGRHT